MLGEVGARKKAVGLWRRVMCSAPACCQSLLMIER